MPLPLEILVNMCIAIVCYPGCDVINYEMNLIFLIKKSRQKLKYLESEKSFKDEIKKVVFIILKGLSNAKNCLRPESAPLNFVSS